ncbi:MULTISPECIES: thioredoxin domain-containing protein [unclassified Nitratiruptor]|uniref:thioredoxin domain-containing protein n=1 Tax=unclassified Nitratiruptor TaxID=2624044 RepID=UPI0019153B98|nr:MULTISPECIES: thioredoxin domain-containing protein [unclassified Nitratiruptor]BCD60147.1 hypothetical protein NitYY0810_C0912 [Nitratiruptor sp. YY08-10]BCD64364.1 hypothetical protein NitYY0814_C1209 [Nitratiruptor sp. YY08-14]
MRLIVLLFVSLFLFAQTKYTNDLIYEESPYLRQHAHNPVHWLPWGKKAFELAKKLDKPIFLSIGYSTCHWCHVMEKESFENEAIAELINRYYVPIKVDKEERPDLDKFYQSVFAVMHHRSGGWPLTIIMTPDKKPYFSATYIPPEDGYGVEGMTTILPKYAALYHEQKQRVQRRGEAVLKLVDKVMHATLNPVRLDKTLALKALKEAEKDFDPVYGGFSKRVKFPESSTILMLLDIYQLTDKENALKMAMKSLDAMAKGGIFDQIEGAFFRYSTRRDWSAPHFEKMLYTNAELIRVYTKAYTITKKPLYKEVVQRTIKEIDHRFGHDGLYFSASDADTKGEEGGYFLFRYEDTLRALQKAGVKNPKKELENLSIEPNGNFDGEYSNPIKCGNVSSKTLRVLQRLRKQREYPFIDQKIITAWNAMYIEAKMKSFIFDKRYKDEAIQSLNRLIQTMWIDGELFHQKLPHSKPKRKALLEDYAYLIKALTTAYMLSFNEKYLELAVKLFKKAKAKFYKGGIWYMDARKSVAATIDDSYYSSPLAVLYHAMLDLALLTYDLRLYDFAKKSIDGVSALIHANPANYPTATLAALRVEFGDVVIKSNKNVLQKVLKKIAFISYPFLLDKKENLKGFEACTVQTCFIQSDHFEDIVKAIEQRVLTKEHQGGWFFGKR